MRSSSSCPTGSPAVSPAQNLLVDGGLHLRPMFHGGDAARSLRSALGRTERDRDRADPGGPGRTRRGHAVGPGSTGAVVGRYLGKGNPSSCGDGPRRRLRDAGICRLRRNPREGRAGGRACERLLLLRPRHEHLDCSRGACRHAPRRAVQRRQARPAGALLSSETVFEIPPRKTEYVGALYRLDPDLTLPPDGRRHRLVERPRLQPGQPRHVLRRQPGRFRLGLGFRPGQTGDVDHQRIFIDSPAHRRLADGATVDAEGCYWMTLPECGKLSTATARRPADANIYADRDPTCCEFGGPNLDVLYVTSARLRKLTDPLAGALFALDVGVKGLPLPFFKG